MSTSKFSGLYPAVTVLALLCWNRLESRQWPEFNDLFEKSRVAIAQSIAPQQPLELSNNSTFTQMVEQYAAGCPAQFTKPRVFSEDPLMVYIEDYLSPAEAKYLLHVAEGRWHASPVSTRSEIKGYDPEFRSSLTAVLPGDPVVNCVEERAASTLGFLPLSHIEPSQAVKYKTSELFRPHFDWMDGMANPRSYTLFGYLACDGENGEGSCEGGNTQFPNFSGRFPATWCQKFVDCNDESGLGGVAFKPVVGNAIYWANYYPNGTGHPGSYHAGMPVKVGRKIGLNQFARRDPWDSEAFLDP